MVRFVLVVLGGAFGTAARYGIGLLLAARAPDGFPAGTFAVNVLGCLLMGVLMQTSVSTSLLSATTRIALTTGIMGGFTTYSAFNYETSRMISQGHTGRAAVYVGLTLAVCGLAGWLGMAGVQRVVARG